MGKRGPKTGLATRRDNVSAAGALIEEAVGHERNAYEMWKAIKAQSRVANAQFNKTSRHDAEGLPVWELMTTHQKMKIAQDFLVTAFMTPEIGVRFLEAAMQDPIAVAKLTFSVMPKELHVDVQQQSGVVLLPMKAESLESWTKMVEGHANRPKEVKDVSPDEFWSKKLGGSNEYLDGDSTGGGDSSLDVTGSK